MGKVMRCSTSSGPSAGAIELICTCTGVVSGKASMSSWPSATTPTAAAATAAMITSTRCLSEKSIVWLRKSKIHRKYKLHREDAKDAKRKRELLEAIDDAADAIFDQGDV